MRSMFAHRSFLDHGIKVAGASDYIPGPYEPLMAIQSMVTRKDYRGRVWGGNQRITVDEALRICTLHGAHASFEPVHLPQAEFRPVSIPSYNGARKQPNLVPLLALLLAREGVPVLVHGVTDDPGRRDRPCRIAATFGALRTNRTAARCLRRSGPGPSRNARAERCRDRVRRSAGRPG